jgi:magnesium-transporting ATPase (P-type)
MLPFVVSATTAHLKPHVSGSLPPVEDKSTELRDISRTKSINLLKNDITEHHLSLEQLEKEMKTDFSSGLSSEEAAIRLKVNGPNALTPPKRDPLLLKLFFHLAGGFSLLLWVGSVLCLIVYGIDGSIENLTLGIVLAVVVVITGLFSFYQELKSEKVLEGFLKLTPTTCEVLRDGSFRFLIIVIK